MDLDKYKLLDAVKENNIKLAEELIILYKLNIDIIHDDKSVLMIASQLGCTDCVKLLLKYKADPNLCNKYGMTALMYASMNGHTECVSALLNAGADPDKEEMYWDTALIFASYCNHIECVRLLLRAGSKNNIDRYKIYPELVHKKIKYEIIKIIKRIVIVRILNNY